MKLTFKRIGRKIIPFMVGENGALVRLSKKNASKTMKRIKKAAGARTNIHTKRINAISEVSKSIKKRQQFDRIQFKIDKKMMIGNKESKKITDKIEAITKSVKAKIAKNSASMTRKIKKSGFSLRRNGIISSEEFSRIKSNRIYRQIQSMPKVEKLKARDRILTRQWGEQQRLRGKLIDRNFPSGAEAKVFVGKNSVVKTGGSMTDTAFSMTISQRAKTSIILNKAKLTPETFLVKSGNSEFKVMQKANIDTTKNLERIESPSWDHHGDRLGNPNFIDPVNKLEKKIDSKGIAVRDLLNPTNIGTVKGKMVSTDTGQFKWVDAIDFWGEKTGGETLNQFLDKRIAKLGREKFIIEKGKTIRRKLP